MQITFTATATYSDHTHQQTITIEVPPAPVSAPESDVNGADRDDWFGEYLMCHAGDGTGEQEHVVYEVEVLSCAEQPDLVGVEFSGEG